jgi:glycosyltransferase involved in cell wall biosynthesis
LTISEFTRWGLINALGAPADKIRVTYPGVEPHYQPRDRIHSAHYIAEKFYVSNNYICAVGTVEPRKNLITLMQAIKILRDRGMLKHQLLIAGASGWKNSRIYAAVQRLGLTEREVKFLGHVPEEDLPVLYSGSCLFVFPSIYEGFGLPLLEAMASGVPVVASNVASMPEVVRDAAVLVSPLQPEEFADAIALVVSNEQLRQALIDKGIRRAQQFRWDTSARQILQLFKEVAHRPAESTANRASD